MEADRAVRGSDSTFLQLNPRAVDAVPKLRNGPGIRLECENRCPRQHFKQFRRGLPAIGPDVQNHRGIGNQQIPDFRAGLNPG